MSRKRIYRSFAYREAVFRICCERFDEVTAEIVLQRQTLEDYIRRHPEFGSSLEPLAVHDDAPKVARRMARAARLVGVGPMAAVAGAMAQCAAEAGLKDDAKTKSPFAPRKNELSRSERRLHSELISEPSLRAGAREVIVENGGDIYLQAGHPVTIALHTGTAELGDRLAFLLQPDDTPISICSSSGKMGHSMSLGDCDLATVVAKDAALADAAATEAANLVTAVGEVDAALERIAAIEGVDGVLIVENDHIGMAGQLPRLVKTTTPG